MFEVVQVAGACPKLAFLQDCNDRVEDCDWVEWGRAEPGDVLLAGPLLATPNFYEIEVVEIRRTIAADNMESDERHGWCLSRPIWRASCQASSSDPNENQVTFTADGMVSPPSCDFRRLPAAAAERFRELFYEPVESAVAEEADSR